MGIVNMYMGIKEVHPKDILLIKSGSFYNCYGKDSYIISYLFGYSIRTIDISYPTASFPLVSFDRVVDKLESLSINYVELVRQANYEVIRKGDFKSDNRYDEFYPKAYQYIIIKKKIDDINNYLIDNINSNSIKSIIRDIEEILDENRKI